MIKIDRDNLMDNKSSLDSIKSEFDELIVKMEGVMNDITNNWEGQASSAYQTQFEELKQGAFTQISELMQTISTQIEQVCDNADDFDSSTANQIR